MLQTKLGAWYINKLLKNNRIILSIRWQKSISSRHKARERINFLENYLDALVSPLPTETNRTRRKSILTSTFTPILEPRKCSSVVLSLPVFAPAAYKKLDSYKLHMTNVESPTPRQVSFPANSTCSLEKIEVDQGSDGSLKDV